MREDQRAFARRRQAETHPPHGVIRFTAIISREPLVACSRADAGSPKQKSEAGSGTNRHLRFCRQEAVSRLRSLRHPAGIDDIMGALLPAFC